MDELQSDADLCVKCGLCLPHCPTYGLTGNENESPRGRIALIQAYAGGRLEATPKLIAHIDNCLLCRACETVCPAEVPYGRLVDHFRARTRPHRLFAPAAALLKKIAANERYRGWAQKGLQFYQHHPLGIAARRLGALGLFGFGPVERLLPPAGEAAADLQDYYPAQGHVRGDVGLFKGCLGPLLDHATLAAAVRCLTAAGFNVHIPAAQTCCGALDQHDGNADAARAFAETNGRAFAAPQLTAIVTVASGCGAQLKEYQDAARVAQVVDISRFLGQCADFSDRLRPLAARVCLHSPCSLKNVMREEEEPLKLLRQIPELDIALLLPAIGCCGAAGSYVLKHPEIANALAEEVLRAAIAAQADYLVTSNIGCALHLAASLRAKGSQLRVVHPVILLAQQLR
ncbi:MAG: (Fe-S)-binding protein [Gammaproteobacteria bacterium]